jgi:uncharacterized integral membrane protein
MGKVKIIAAVLVAAYVIAVFVQNSEPVDFRFLFFGTISVPRTLLIIASGLLGSAVTFLSQFIWRRRKRPSPAAVTQSSAPSPSN